MSLTDKILVGFLLTFITWVISNITVYVREFIQYKKEKRRLESAIILEIKLHLRDLDSAVKYVNKMFGHEIKVGKIIDYDFKFTESSFLFYTSVQSKLYLYFDEPDLEKVMKFYDALNEVQVLLTGFSDAIYVYKNNKIPINDDDYAYLSRKCERITSIAAIINQRCKKVIDLPDDYRGALGPMTIVENSELKTNIDC